MLGGEKWTVSCCVSKKGYHSHQQLLTSSVSRWALRNSGRRISALWQPSDCRHSKVSPEERKVTMWKQDAGPHRGGAYERSDFSEPGLGHLPIHRRALNCLTQDIWFSLTVIFSYSDYLPCVTKLCVIPWTEEPGGLQSTGSKRVGHDWNVLARTHTVSIVAVPNCHSSIDGGGFSFLHTLSSLGSL